MRDIEKRIDSKNREKINTRITISELEKNIEAINNKQLNLNEG